MFLERFFGWLFLLIAFFTASAEAVAALNTGEYSSIAACDVLTIITGISLKPTDTFAGLILLLPAWVIIGTAGILLLFFSRRKKHKLSFPLKN